MRALAAALLLACLSLAVACGGSSRQAPSFGSATAGASPVATAASDPAQSAAGATTGCGRAHAAGESGQTLVSDGVARSYRLYVPKGYDGSKPLPLVLSFHGYGGSGRGQELLSGMPAEADMAGFVTVAPDGTGSPPHWDLSAQPAAGEVDDFAFVRRMIDALSQSLCIDPARVYATGMSDGGFFSSELACQLSDRLAAAAPVAGEPYVASLCDGKPAVPLIAFHGDADLVVPFAPPVFGEVLLGMPGLGTQANMRLWAQHAGCDAASQTQPAAEGVTLQSYVSCRNGADVQLYVIAGGGHDWPGSHARGRGATTQSISATDLIWRFFAAHPRAK